MAKKRKDENLGPHPILMWIFVIILIGVLVFLINSTLFNVTEITVTGNKSISSDDIIIASGITYGTNIFHVDEYAAKENIEKNAYLVVEDISRTFPTGVIIKVRERVPVAQIGTINGYYVIDKEGIALDLIPVRNEVLTVVTNMGITQPNYAQKIVGESDEKLNAMFRVLEAIEEYKLSGIITGIDLNDPQKIMLTYKGEIKVQIAGAYSANDRLKNIVATVESVRDKLQEGSVIHLESEGGFYIG
ncbi:MAG: FtsQ-type POTRA domain-containing protein [Clostridia bacterium]|nr:FtsQ-type POTRA domain-containing protein [Clostridia bacterium]